MKLIKISDKKEIWVNPEFVNVVAELVMGEDIKTEVSTCYTRVCSELPVVEILKRLNLDAYPTE